LATTKCLANGLKSPGHCLWLGRGRGCRFVARDSSGFAQPTSAVVDLDFTARGAIPGQSDCTNGGRFVCLVRKYVNARLGSRGRLLHLKKEAGCKYESNTQDEHGDAERRLAANAGSAATLSDVRI
jgi:hypothetical protein